LSQFTKNFSTFYSKIVTKLSNIWVRDPGSEENLFQIPDFDFLIQGVTNGSRICITGRRVNSIFCLFCLGSRFLFSLEYPRPVFTCAFLPACHCTVNRIACLFICTQLFVQCTYTRYGAAFSLPWNAFHRSSCPHPASFYYPTGSGSGIVFSVYRTACLSCVKGTVSRDFLLLVFYMNQFPPST
jgi:hypothetical protein